MKRPLLLDTDVLIDFLRGYGEAVVYVRRQSDRIILSAIVVAELYAGVKGAEETTRLDDLASLFPVIPVTREIAKVGGLYKRDYGASHGVGIADGILAATAESQGADFITLNVKHFPMLVGLVPPYSKKKSTP